MIGHRFGRLLVRARAENAGKHVRWACVCECGVECMVSTSHLRSGHTKSCGCLLREVTIARNKAGAIHGMADSAEYNIWRKMISRCHDERDANFPKYGARGITVCDEWRASFQAFFDHVGPRPSAGHSLERERNEGGYMPGNVRWATAVEQNNNRRSNVTMEIDGLRMTAAQIAEKFALTHRAVCYRIEKGWPVEQVIRPLRGRK